ncbi:MAG: hypothetical protein HN563_05640 [Flavobacteriales bacterium]|jgi:hypothetical protein|nr:hypothetical protein [Flavobacteriales bacterium]
MKNLFTLCACAFLTFTLSAQSEQAAGSYYLGTGDATTIMNVFSTGVSMSPTLGYAVIDDLVVSGAINSDANDDIDLNLNVRYFWSGVFFQVGADNLLSAGDADMSISLGAGKYFQLNALSDRLYVDPQINYNLDTGFNTMIGFGARF